MRRHGQEDGERKFKSTQRVILKLAGYQNDPQALAGVHRFEKDLLQDLIPFVKKRTPMTTKMAGIYAIKNKITGDVYVGQSINLKARWAGHFRLLFSGKHQNRKLQDDFSNYGSDAFVCSRLEFCLVELLCERETHYTTLLGATYNQASPPKRICRNGPRFNPLLQELRRWKRRKLKK